jgi:NADPH:quinone reductase-like Zn-dependent oxidoreductase
VASLRMILRASSALRVRASGGRWLATGATDGERAFLAADPRRRPVDRVLPRGTRDAGWGRRVLVAAIIVATLLTIPTVISDFSAAYTLVAALTSSWSR